jgi:hypothetical protein
MPSKQKRKQPGQGEPREMAWRAVAATHGARPIEPFAVMPDLTRQPPGVVESVAWATGVAERAGIRIKDRMMNGRPFWADRAGWPADASFWRVGLVHGSNWDRYTAGVDEFFEGGSEAHGIIPCEAGSGPPTLGLVVLWALVEHRTIFGRYGGDLRRWREGLGLPVGDAESRMIWRSHGTFASAVAAMLSEGDRAALLELVGPDA